jgi:hypothetical protein
MIYHSPTPDDVLDQGDLIDGCPVTTVTEFPPTRPEMARVQVGVHRIIVLTQTCDLANRKAEEVTVASVFDAEDLVKRDVLKPAEIKGPLRAGRVWGWYFLPAQPDLGLAEMIVDLRRLHTARLDLLTNLCRGGGRRGRLPPPYREHLAKHFADTFSRIGLPRPYETL